MIACSHDIVEEDTNIAADCFSCDPPEVLVPDYSSDLSEDIENNAKDHVAIKLNIQKNKTNNNAQPRKLAKLHLECGK